VLRRNGASQRQENYLIPDFIRGDCVGNQFQIHHHPADGYLKWMREDQAAKIPLVSLPVLGKGAEPDVRCDDCAPEQGGTGKLVVVRQGGAVVCLSRENVDATLCQLGCHGEGDVNIEVKPDHGKRERRKLMGQGGEFDGER
jgi:hypothetical protein